MGVIKDILIKYSSPMCSDVSIQMKPCDVGDEVRTVEGVAGET